MPAASDTATAPRRRPRVLVIAEAANPEWVSVPLVGWSLAAALRQVADVHLVTQVRNREAILRAGWVEGREFTAIDSERLAAPMWALARWLRMGEGKGWTMVQALGALSYPYFERLVWQRFGPALRAGEYDLVHRVTPLSPTVTSPIARRCQAAGVPFVLGPLNGGLPWPEGFDAERRREREWLSYLRGAYRLLPGRRAMFAATAAVFAGSRHTAAELPEALRDRVVWLPENAIDPARFHPPAPRPAPAPGQPLRAAFIGRMVPYKGPDMLIEAAAPLLRDGRLRLEMIGDGPMLPDLQAQAAALGLEPPALTFHGWLEHGAVHRVAGGCDLLTFPSIREFGGGAVLEAMALGLVPVVVDYGGPGELVDDSTGFRLALGPRARIVADLRTLLEELAADASGLPALAARARATVEERFTWARKAEQVARVHDWVLAGHPGSAPQVL